MIKGLKIASVFVLLLIAVSCEKCDKPVQMDDPFVNSMDRSASDDKGDGVIYGASGTRGDELDLANTGGNGSSGGSEGDITDPDEDEDYDGIVDPDEDEDFDKDGK